MRRPVYIAGPYAASSEAERLVNVERARLLGRLAVFEGLAPIVPHLHGAAGLYGLAADNGGESESRRVALACSEALAYTVGRAGGSLWAIGYSPAEVTYRGLKRSLSEGTALEWAAWERGRDELEPYLMGSAAEGSWGHWERRIRAARLS